MSTALSWRDRALDCIFPYRAPAREIHEAVIEQSALVASQGALMASVAELAQAMPRLKRVEYGVIQQWHVEHRWLNYLPWRVQCHFAVTTCPICQAPGCLERTIVTPLPDGFPIPDPAGRALTADEYAAILSQ